VPFPVAVLLPVPEVDLEAVLEAELEVGPGTEAVLVAGLGIEVDLEVDPGTVAVLEVGPGTEVDPGIEAGPALAEGEHSLVVAEEELQAQTEGELADPALSRAWAPHSCPCPA